MSELVGGAAAGLALAAGLGAWISPTLLARRRSVRGLGERCRRTRSLVLTYDDGPGPELTHRVLDLLAEYDARASFYLLGRRVANAPEAVDRIAAEGHEIGTHSHEHLHAWKSLPSSAVRDVRRGFEAVERWTGPRPSFRPPYGKLTLATWREVRRRGAPIHWWTHDSHDSWGTPRLPAEFAAALARDGGGVVLMHDFDRDGPDRAARTEYVLETTRRLLETAAAEGLQVRRLADLPE